MLYTRLYSSWPSSSNFYFTIFCFFFDLWFHCFPCCQNLKDWKQWITIFISILSHRHFLFIITTIIKTWYMRNMERCLCKLNWYAVEIAIAIFIISYVTFLIRSNVVRWNRGNFSSFFFLSRLVFLFSCPFAIFSGHKKRDSRFARGVALPPRQRKIDNFIRHAWDDTPRAQSDLDFSCDPSVWRTPRTETLDKKKVRGKKNKSLWAFPVSLSFQQCNSFCSRTKKK